MKQKIPHSVWNITALFSFTWFLTAGWLIWDGETSPIVRFVFALSGSAGTFTGHAGGLFATMARVACWLDRKRTFHGIAILCGLLLVAAILLPGCLGAQRRFRAMDIAGDLKRDGLQILDYAENHGGFLPPQMGRGDVYRYIIPMEGRKNPYSGRFKWCSELGGIYLGDVSRPDEVVVAYAAKEEGVWRPILFLDGHVKSVHTRKQLTEMLRARPALLELALERKTQREAKVIKEESRVPHASANKVRKENQKW